MRRRYFLGDLLAVGLVPPPEPYYFESPRGTTPSARKFGVEVGCQVSLLTDPAAGIVSHFAVRERVPSPMTAGELLEFLRGEFDRRGLPRVGVLFAESVWRSTKSLLEFTETRERAEAWLALCGGWAEMPRADRDRVAEELEAMQLKTFWSEDEL